MKLSDIFKLDLNTGGGNKLFARIMNKYNVPKKEYENVKQEMNSFGGGGDSGSSDDSAEYYKVNNFNYLKQFSIVMYMVSLSHYISNDNNEFIAPFIISTDSGNPGVKIAYKICYIPVIFNLNGISISLEDTLYNVFYKNVKLLNPTMSDEEINTLFNATLTPITKEEFYDLNNI